MWNVEGDYGKGWEVLVSEETENEAKRLLKEYDDNEKNVPHRITEE